MRTSTVILAVPVIIVAAVIAVANRQPATFSLDPFDTVHPSLAFSMPLFGMLFLALLLGVLLGGATATIWRTRRRKAPLPLPVADHALSEPETKPLEGDSRSV